MEVDLHALHREPEKQKEYLAHVNARRKALYFHVRSCLLTAAVNLFPMADDIENRRFNILKKSIEDAWKESQLYYHENNFIALTNILAFAHNIMHTYCRMLANGFHAPDIRTYTEDTPLEFANEDTDSYVFDASRAALSDDELQTEKNAGLLPETGTEWAKEASAEIPRLDDLEHAPITVVIQRAKDRDANGLGFSEQSFQQMVADMAEAGRTEVYGYTFTDPATNEEMRLMRYPGCDSSLASHVFRNFVVFDGQLCADMSVMKNIHGERLHQGIGSIDAEGQRWSFRGNTMVTDGSYSVSELFSIDAIFDQP